MNEVNDCDYAGVYGSQAAQINKAALMRPCLHSMSSLEAEPQSGCDRSRQRDPGSPVPDAGFQQCHQQTEKRKYGQQNGRAPDEPELRACMGGACSHYVWILV